MLIDSEIAPNPNPNPKSYRFKIEVAGGEVTVTPDQPAGQSSAGMYAGGNARIRKGSPQRTLVWHCATAFSVAFEELDSDEQIGSGLVGDLFETPLPGNSTLNTATNRHEVMADLKAGGGPPETVVYKYTVVVGEQELDPLIIVDR